MSVRLWTEWKMAGWPRQRELLEKEGVRFKANGCADIARFMWEEIL